LSSSSRESERINEAIEKCPWNLDDIGLRRRPSKKRRRPELLAHESQGIGKRRQSFGIPRCLANRKRLLIQQVMGKKGYEGEQPIGIKLRKGDKKGSM
jgi:hypothetical protein